MKFPDVEKVRVIFHLTDGVEGRQNAETHCKTRESESGPQIRTGWH
jgi:hypothetical protein